MDKDTRTINVRLTLTLVEGADPTAAAEQVFDLIACDPEDRAPLVSVAEGYEWEEVE